MVKGLFFLAIGIAVAIYMLCFYGKSRKRCTEKLEGTILECLKTADNEHGDAAMDYYIVGYEVEGKTYTAETGCEIAKNRVVGDEIELFYDPQNPQNCFFTMDAGGKRFLALTIWGFALLMFATAGYCFMN